VVFLKHRKEVVKTRILIAFGADYRVYESAIAGAIQERRPHVEVTTAERGDFEAILARFDPHLVICGPPNRVPPHRRPAWIEFSSLGLDQLVAVCVDGEISKSKNPGLNELLSIVDETEKLARTKHDLGDC
jgi:hypothetical protein